MARLAYIQDKIVSIEEAQKRIALYKLKNEALVFTNGCFDILHQGHVVYLAKAAEMGNKFSELLDKYPVTPYLDNRDSFVRWTHFIHNKYNVLLGKEEISLPVALERYRDAYKPKPVYLSEKIKIRKKYIFATIIFALLILIYFNYH